MQRLAGEVIARVAYALRRCSKRPMALAEIESQILAALHADGLYAQGSTVVGPAAEAAPQATRANAIDSENLERLNALLPWSEVADAGNGRPLGTWWSARRHRPAATRPLDSVRAVSSRIDLHGLRALELGCLDGVHAVGLALAGARVLAVDARIENVVKTLVRAWAAGVGESVQVLLIDLDRESLTARLAKTDVDPAFDLIHHRDLLHHLAHPVDHLKQCAELSRGHLYLNTLVVGPDEPPAAQQVTVGGLQVDLHHRAQPRAPHLPFGGTLGYARWISEGMLERLLVELGFEAPRQLRTRAEGGGRRVELMTRRHRTAAAALPQPCSAAAADAPIPLATPPAPRPERFRKAVVLGIGRSGTSAVASLLRQCGFHLGADADHVLNESVYLRSLLLQGRLAEISDLMDTAAAAHTHIAWKDPKLHTAGAEWVRALPPDWLVLVVFRDPVATAHRRVLADGVTFEQALTHCVEMQHRLHAFVSTLDKKVVALSYERLMFDHAEVLSQVLAHVDPIGLPPADFERIWAGMLSQQRAYRETQVGRDAP